MKFNTNQSTKLNKISTSGALIDYVIDPMQGKGIFNAILEFQKHLESTIILHNSPQVSVECFHF